ncbi:MAG: MaoC family dehydratase N-terminal domain-containing protein [Rhodobacteraceae bacterium]|jgi:acyl dehydratase|nr:MaoC family dehydratase N-terminal domain-containing protein [Paracoccaceae bacterium]
MYVDRDMALALALEPIPVEVERGRLRLYAKAIGETNPVYTDVAAARAQGYPDLPAPPSFLGNAVELDIPEPLSWMSAVGIDITSTLHGEQSMVYHKMVFAGDSLLLARRIVDVYVKKAGTLEFVVKRTDVLRGNDLVAEAYCSIAVLHPEAGK